MPFTQSDPDHLKMYPLNSRKSKSSIRDIAIDPDQAAPPNAELQWQATMLAQKIMQAREKGAAVILAYGAHLIKNGAAPLLIQLLEEGWLTHLATQGAGGIHDWEYAFLGRSEEDVRANVANGTFGTWEETGKYINLAVLAGTVRDMGYGESLGAMIQEDGIYIPDGEVLQQAIRTGLHRPGTLFAAQAELYAVMEKFELSPGFLAVPHPHKKYSVAAAAFRLHIPYTIHPGIGYDIIYNSPYASGAALGRGGHTDFKIFCNSVANLSGGVFISVGSAIMAPQIFEKALSFANNLLLQKGEKIQDLTIIVNDLQPCRWDWSKSEPPKESPDYYLRFLKSFYRAGGQVTYIAADNREFLQHVYKALSSNNS